MAPAIARHAINVILIPMSILSARPLALRTLPICRIYQRCRQCPFVLLGFRQFAVQNADHFQHSVHVVAPVQELANRTAIVLDIATQHRGRITNA